MTVAIDRFKTSHNSLQYNVDRFVKLLSDGKAVFLHNGHISSMKSNEIVAVVSRHGDGIISDFTKDPVVKTLIKPFP